MNFDMPDDLRRQVMKEIYRVADTLDWDELAQPQRSAWYDRWLDQPAIGDVLTRFAPRERARVWIKDFVMKQYGKARAGIGPYRDLVAQRLPDQTQVATHAFGAGWIPIDGSFRDKPYRCLVTDGSERRLMIWGPAENLRALVWAGINAIVDQEPQPLIVILGRPGHKLTDSERLRHRLLCQQGGLDLRHVTIRPRVVAPS
jgi:hypothetical protein